MKEKKSCSDLFADDIALLAPSKFSIKNILDKIDG
jgi:hypothetical protein